MFMMGPCWPLYIWCVVNYATCSVTALPSEAVNFDGDRKANAGPTLPRGHYNIATQKEEEWDVTNFMQRDGAQPGRVDQDTLMMLEDVVRGKVLAIRRRRSGRAKFVLSTLMKMLRRGMRSRLE